MMPPGKYYVGDLCYVMHPQWGEFCELTIVDGRCLEGQFHLKNGVVFAAYGTRWGDGCYTDGQGNEYSVDAGLIGCILVSDIDDPGATDLSDLGAIHEFVRPFRTWSDGRVIHFGDVAIDTDPDPVGDDEENEYDYQDEE